MNRRRRSTPALAMLVALAACSDGAATAPLAAVDAEVALGNAAAAPSFDDAFDAFDASRWVKQHHPLGRGVFDSANVVAAGGVIELVHPAGTVNGGEIKTVARYGYGTYEARIRTPAAPGSISAFFLYQFGTRSNDELDIEIFNDGSRRVMFTVWVADRQKYNVTKVLPFDPSAAFHRYRIDWRAGRVEFLVDGVSMQVWSHKKNVPTNAMHVMANSWWPTWLTPAPLGSDQAMLIDQVVATPR